MKDEDLYDEEGRDLSIADRAHGRMLLEGFARYNHWLAQTTERLAREHGLRCRGPLRKLLQELWSLPKNHPPILSVKPEDFAVEKGLTPWKKAKEQLETLSKVLADAEERLYDAVENPVQCAALLHADTTEGISGFIAGVSELRELVQRASGIEGKSGNRPNPDWHARAAEMCREFWREHTGETPSRYFNKASKPKSSELATSAVTEPANKFSSWFCDVMHEVAQLTPTQCDTALRKRRPQMTAEFWKR